MERNEVTLNRACFVLFFNVFRLLTAIQAKAFTVKRERYFQRGIERGDCNGVLKRSHPPAGRYLGGRGDPFL